MGVVTTDDHQAPVLAFWHRGLGRVAALTAEVHGEYSTSLNAWPGFQAFAIGLGRWLLGGDPPTGVQASIDRQGGQGIVRLELDPAHTRGGPDDVRAATATIVAPDHRAGDTSERLNLAWVGENALEARFPLQRAGLYVGAVQLGQGAVLSLAPLSLPYSPEFEPRQDPGEGRAALAEVARITGGVERAAWDDVFERARIRNRQVRDLVIPLALLLLVLHIVEIGGRRLLLFEAAWRRIRAVRLPRLRRRRARHPDSARGREVVGASPPAASAPPVEPTRGMQEKPATSPLARAKAKARGRLGE
jgi:hypothetical protein